MLEMVFDELADAWRAVDVRNNLEEKIWSRERGFDVRQISFAVLVAHRAGRNAKRPVIQRSDECVDLGSQGRLRQFLRKAPELAAPGDRPLVVEEHAVSVAALAAAEGNGNYLPALGVIAEAVRIRHADEFVFHQRFALVEFERLGHHRAQLRRIGAIGDDQVFAVDEPVRSGRIGRAGQRHREGALQHLFLMHCGFSLC